MLVMAKSKRQIDWPARLKNLQEWFGITNAEMAKRLGASNRTYLAWKYGERCPSGPAIRLIELLETTK